MKMIKILRLAFLCLLLSSCALWASGVEIWKCTNVKGQTRFLMDNKDVSDGFEGQVIVIKFLENSGTVSGTGSQIVKIADDTLIGYGFESKGDGSIVEVYQINKKTNKLQMTQSRINMGRLDKVSYFVGDAELITNDLSL